MNRISLRWAGLSLIAVIGIVFVTPLPGTKVKIASGGPVIPVNEPGTTAGLKLHVDPATGRIVPPPAQVAPDPAAKAAFNSSHDGLVEEPGTTVAGGFKVDTRGRFRSAVILRLGADGKPSADCVDATEAGPRVGE